MTSNVCRHFSSVSVWKSVTELSAACKKVHGVSFLAAHMVDIIEEIVLFDVLIGYSNQKRQSYIFATKFLFQRPNIIIVLRVLIGGRPEPGHSASRTSTMKACSRPGYWKERFWSVTQASTFKTRLSTICFTFFLFAKSKRCHLCQIDSLD